MPSDRKTVLMGVIVARLLAMPYRATLERSLAPAVLSSICRRPAFLFLSNLRGYEVSRDGPATRFVRP